MSKICLIILFGFLIGCSFDTKSGIWSQETKIQEQKKNSTQVFKKEEIINKEFNSKLRIKLDPKDYSDTNIIISTNNQGVLDFNKNIEKFSKFKFSKINKFNYFEPEIVFDDKNFIFFDDKANLIKFDDEFKTIWKKNFYSKQEKKLKPILTLALSKKFLIVVDSIGKIYSVNTSTGELIWTKTNSNPFNSQIKIYKEKIYVVDINNVLRCFSLLNGKEIWKFNSDNTFLKSSKRNSIIVVNETVFFNNSYGDIIAVDANYGNLIWQTPTQSNAVYNDILKFQMSDLVLKDDKILFSNNKNEFFSININNGLLNWKQNINSNIRPIVLKNLTITFSNEGFLLLLDNNTGSIIRSTYVFNYFKVNKRNKIKPVGFILGKEKVLLTTDQGHLLIINFASGRTEKVLKIDNDKISRPFVFNKSIILIKDNSVIRLN